MAYYQTRLSNGLKLIFIPAKATKAVTVLVMLPVGSRYETPGANGVSHFIEHMMFKGTKRRPSNLAIAKELDKIGAQYNAFTGKDHTGYWVKVVGEKMGLAFDILADILFNSLFDRAEFQREKGVIIEEIKMYEENPLFHIEDLFEKLLFGVHPLGALISGQISAVKKMTRQKLLSYKEEFYQPSQMLVVVAGDVKKSRITRLVKRYFSLYHGRKRKNKYLPFEKKITRVRHRVSLLFKDIKQVQIALGGLAYPYTHPKLEAASLLGIILGGNMSSRLFTEVRVKRGLAYFINSSLGVYQDTGEYEIRAGVDRERTPEALRIILDELKKIKEKEVAEEELSRAKDYVKGTLSLSLEDSANLASWYGKQALLASKILTPKEKLTRIERVTQKDIQKVANDFFASQGLNLALIGPFKQNKPFLRILKEGV